MTDEDATTTRTETAASLEAVDVEDLLERVGTAAGTGTAADGTATAPGNDEDDRTPPVRTLLAVAREDPDRLLETFDRVRPLLEAEDDDVRAAALLTARRTAERKPELVDDDVVETLVSRLGREPQHGARIVAETLALVLDPGEPAFERAFERLFDLLEGDERERGSALQALVTIGDAVPEPVVGRLVRELESASESRRRLSVRGLAALAEDDPGAVAPAVPALLDRLEGEAPYTIEHAASALASVAGHDPTAVRQAIDRLAPLLEAGSDRTRRSVVGILAELGRHDPGDLEPLVAALVDRLDDPDRIVRRDACYALGVLRAGAAREPIATRRDSDDLEFRAVAAAAVERIDGGEMEPPLTELEPGSVFVERNGP